MFLWAKKNKKILFIGTLVFIIISFFATELLQEYKNVMLEKRKEETKQHVLDGYELLLYYDDRAENSELTEKQAKTYAKDSIKSISPKSYKYYWINDDHQVMIMHPAKPELNGKDLTNYKGPDGQYIFVEFTKIAKEKGGGFVEYLWQKPKSKNKDKLYPKISYIKYFKHWGWIIGSGVYVDDINNAFWKAVYIVFGIGIAILFFVWILVATIFEGLKK